MQWQGDCACVFKYDLRICYSNHNGQNAIHVNRKQYQSTEESVRKGKGSKMGIAVNVFRGYSTISGFLALFVVPKQRTFHDGQEDIGRPHLPFFLHALSVNSTLGVADS